MIQKDDIYIRDLWIKYKTEKSIQHRNELIIHYSGLVNRVVNRITLKYGNYLDIDDLVSYGIFGLMDAIEKYNPYKGVKFETYASFRIRGEIIDRIRQQDWVPRSIRSKAKEIEDALEKLKIKLGKEPDSKEIASYMGITLKDLNKIMGQIHTYAIISLDGQILDIIGNSTGLASEEKTPEEYAIAEELKEILGDALEQLTENEQIVISLYYFEELTLREIGMTIGISESRVSQLHSRALLKLKGRLGKSYYK